MLNSRFDPPHVILILIAHGQMQRLIPPADAVELEFVFICILTLCIRVAYALMCLMTCFHRLD